MSEEAARQDDRARGDLSIRVAASIGAFSREEWNSLAGTTRTAGGSGYNPFISYDFLTALEESGCAVTRSGWQGYHLRLEDADGRLLGAAPCYLKSHSQGEYVFDHGWADAFERAGGSYYPKLQASVPFTPVTGPRLLVAETADGSLAKPALAAALRQVADKMGVSSAHVTFAPEQDAAALSDAGSCAASTNNSISSTKAMAVTKTSWGRWHHANAKR